MHQQVGQPAFDRAELIEAGVGGVELLGQPGDAVFQRAERELVALAQLRAVEPLAQLADRAFELRRHRAAAFHHGGDARFQPGERFGRAFGRGPLELCRQPAHLGGQLRQSAVGRDVRHHAAQRGDRLLELLERARIAARRLRGFGNHVDLLRQRAHRVLEADEAFGGREAAQRVADLGKLLFEHREGGTLRARLPAVADALGQRPDLGFQRFDRAARHRLGQRVADFGEVFAQRADRAFVGLMQRRDLRVEFVKLLLNAREIVRRVPGRGLRRGGGERRSGLRSAAVERALPRRNLLGPACRSSLGRGRLLRRHGRECRLSWRRRRVARLLVSELLRSVAPFGDHLIEPAVEPRQRVGDTIRGARIGSMCARARRRSGRKDGSRRKDRRLRRRACLREASLSHPLKLSRQVVETVVNGSEVFILVVHLIPICSSPLPHAFLRSFDGYAGTVQPLEPARAYEQEATGAVPETPR